jgi:D-glycero-beta-D-manno-heptose-7-phosphate kinase
MKNRRHLDALMDAFSGKRVLVLGDVMLDAFTWGEVSRISPEAPVPVVRVLGETFRPGGSANVTANIKALGGDPLTVALVGRDAWGERLRSLFAEEGLESTWLVDDDRKTTLKNRIIANNQQVVRADSEDTAALSAEINNQIVERFLEVLQKADAVVVSDYEKGVVNPHVLGRVLPEAARAGIPVFVDPKVSHADAYRSVTVMTPNTREAEMLSGVPIRDRESLEVAGRMLRERFLCQWALITRGREGMSLFSSDGAEHMPAEAREVFDVSGAGDTVVATLALAYAAGAELPEAARLANHAAGIVVGKIGTAVVTRTELAHVASHG